MVKVNKSVWIWRFFLQKLNYTEIIQFNNPSCSSTLLRGSQNCWFRARASSSIITTVDGQVVLLNERRRRIKTKTSAELLHWTGRFRYRWHRKQNWQRMMTDSSSSTAAQIDRKDRKWARTLSSVFGIMLFYFVARVCWAGCCCWWNLYCDVCFDQRFYYEYLSDNTFGKIKDAEMI